MSQVSKVLETREGSVGRLTPLRFAPVYKTVIWGGERIGAYKSVELGGERIGESWEISGIPGLETRLVDGPHKGKTLNELVEIYGHRLIGQRLYRLGVREFPLLIKFIDARSDLSLQVHPGEEIARFRHQCSGKSEMWYIIDSQPGASIISGFSEPITREEYRSRVADGSIIDAVAVHPTKPGDAFFIPSGRIHAIGAGNLLLEIQQSSDITYRIYDYNRGRELHTDWAAEAIDFRVHDDYRIMPRHVRKGVDVLVQCPLFEAKVLTVDGSMPVNNPGRSFLALTCVEGEATAITAGGECAVAQGHTVLVPAEIASNVTLEGCGKVVVSSC